MTIINAIATNIMYLTISNLKSRFSFPNIDFIRFVPETKTINIEIIYIILWNSIELQMKIMAVLVFCVAYIDAIVYPIEKPYLHTE